MDAYKTLENVNGAYRQYLNSFLSIDDPRIKEVVAKSFEEDGFIPAPLIQFNPSFEKGQSLVDLKDKGEIHEGLVTAFGEYNLYRHQVEALRIGNQRKGFVVTSGTGSGKSLTYLATIFNRLFSMGDQKPKGVKAILVYPMNALINSQEEEIKKYEEKYGGNFPITYAKYTGQEKQDHRDWVKKEQPDIILTNYMMLELIMTRQSESWMRNSIKESLEYLVFDELHTYRGRQGSDVSMLIRRIKGWCAKDLCCIGTSATMSSVGTPEEKKDRIAEVATVIFGDDFTRNQVVGEYLQTCTAGKQFSQSELQKAVSDGIDFSADETAFINHPLTNWLEVKIALKDNHGVLERASPRRLKEISAELEKETNQDPVVIEKVLNDLLRWTENLNEKNRIAGTRKSFLPFRFHQFISQTSTVGVTLESRAERSITIQPGRYFLNEGEEKLLFPVLFSRYSGVDFICVKKAVEQQKFTPRNPGDPINPIKLDEAKGEKLSEENFSEGYLVLDEGEDFWKEDPIEIAPAEWLNTTETEFKPAYKWLMPSKVYFNSEGDYSSKDIYPLKGWFIPVRLRIDPTAGVIYEDTKTSENTKLMSLGNEGRSTATTIMSYAVILELIKQGESIENQKLLSFTDNRQDASLQAGHFNDFLSSVRLRAALNFALQADPTGLNAQNIADRIFEQLKLNEADYAKQPSANPRYPDVDNEKALKAYILYRVFQDLKRGWRYTLPNLEQTAILRIEYKNLNRWAFDDVEFATLPFFASCTGDQRLDMLRQFLNFFRTNYALNHRMLIDAKSEIQALLKDKLNDRKLWSLDHNENIESPTYLVSKKPGRSVVKGQYYVSMGSRSNIGKYFKRKMQEFGSPKMNADEYRTFIETLCDLLVGINVLSRKEDIVGEKGKIQGYLLKADYIEWHPGDGLTVEVDKTRFNSYRNLNLKPNDFFQNLYKTDFSQFKKEIVGREHTGQLSSEARVTREDQFRKGEISSLFCSPTMELGIDIANLNIVHMRNVPPNPANYAQRSGRAGRSGQTAVVFTYCSAMSPHDQNYFRASETMVAGVVAAPRIDLKNEELLTSHFNAYLLMELCIEELQSSVSDILDLTNPLAVEVIPKIIDQIENSLKIYSADWIDSFKQVVAGIEPSLSQTFWFTGDWYERKVASFVYRFKEVFARWIKLYVSALDMMNRAHIVQQDPTLKSDSPQKKEANIQYAVAKKQLALLKNDSRQSIGNDSEFYVFRYLAAEGFLPGYNFTRLPIRTFVGFKSNDQGEYISRPRAVALKEFGPMNIIYHNGSKYRINRMNVLDTESVQRKIKISSDTGYAFLDDEAENANVDPITLTPLKLGENAEFRTTFLELSESEGIPLERISCIEEERNSAGYDIEEFFRYPQGIASTKNAMIQKGGVNLMNLIYGQSSELIKINWGNKRSKHDSFAIDKRNGKWLTQRDLENKDTAESKRDVLLFVRNNADTLYLQPLSNLNLEPEQIISLSYAMKRGLERLFQVEENEVGVRILGSLESPNVLIYEDSEGSLGILSQLIQEPKMMKELFEEAYKCMHFDPVTREETPLGLTLPKASYQDLLSYYNQRDHDLLDRRSIKEVLETLMDCDYSPSHSGTSYDDQYQQLLADYDKSSDLEKRLLDHLYKNKLNLPDKAQQNVQDYYISADFVYDAADGPVLVFCDGSVHDDEDQKKEDNHKRDLLRSGGYDIIVWHYTEKVEDLVLRRKDVFRKVI